MDFKVRALIRLVVVGVCVWICCASSCEASCTGVGLPCHQTGEVWEEVSRELEAEGVEPVPFDHALLQEISQITEAKAEQVLEAQVGGRRCGWDFSSHTVTLSYGHSCTEKCVKVPPVPNMGCPQYAQ